MSASALIRELEDRQGAEPSKAAKSETVKLVRITLAASWPHAVPLFWNRGKFGPNDPGSPPEKRLLKPGATASWPIDKAESLFGPFSVPEQYAMLRDDNSAAADREKERLHGRWMAEKDRVLKRYDYPRESAEKNKPIGPHRFPDLSVVIIDDDGNEGDPIRLHEIYEIGEFDPLKDTFGVHESPEEVKAKYEAQLERQSQNFMDRVAAQETKIAELGGMLKGFIAGKESV